MDPLFLWWLGISIFAGLGLIASAVWGLRHPKKIEDKKITLSNVFSGLFFALCPIINVFVCIGLILYFFFEIAPKIVLFGSKV